MAQLTIGATRLAQATSGAIVNANFAELYARANRVDITATGAGNFVVPAGYLIEYIGFVNTTANAVTGGIKMGKTAGAADVVAAQAVAANATGTVPDANILTHLFSNTTDTTVYYDAVTSWNSASVVLHVLLRKLY